MAPSRALEAAVRKATAKAASERRKAEAKQATLAERAQAVRRAKEAMIRGLPLDVVGVDPGPAKLGYAIIRCASDGSTAFVSGAHVNIAEGRAALDDLARPSPTAVVVFALEQPAWSPHLPDGTALFGTARVEGELAGRYESLMGRPPIRMRAFDWKRLLGGKIMANDHEVMIAIGRMVTGAERVGPHVRDAAGVALAAAKLMGLAYRMVGTKERTG